MASVDGCPPHRVCHGIHHQCHHPHRRHRWSGLRSVHRFLCLLRHRLCILQSKHLHPVVVCLCRSAHLVLLLQCVRHTKEKEDFHGRHGQPHLRNDALLPQHQTHPDATRLPAPHQQVPAGRLAADDTVFRCDEGVCLPSAPWQQPIPARLQPYPPPPDEDRTQCTHYHDHPHPVIGPAHLDQCDAVQRFGGHVAAGSRQHPLDSGQHHHRPVAERQRKKELT